MMWDPCASPKPPFYRRVWFLAPLILIVLAAVGAGVFWLKLKQEYEVKAAAFDMAKLEDMDSASTIYDRNNNVMGRIFMENRDTVALKDFPDVLVQAVIAAEDNRFYQHSGVDYHGMLRAAIKNWRSHDIKQGASTLTQQLARNTFPAQLPARDRTYKRKILEIFVARRIEQFYGENAKSKVLELYLNRVYFGAGFYGAEAAALGYFGKHARDLNLSESATLAGLLKNPNGLSPWSNRQACIDSRNVVLGRMLDLKMLKKEDYDRIVAENLLVKNRRAFHAESYSNDLIRQQVIALVGLDSAVSDGYRIYTTIDVELQRKAEESLRRQLREIEGRSDFQHQTYSQYDALLKQRKKNADADPDNAATAPPMPDYLQGAFVALDNATGGILALIGGRDFNHSQYNRVISAARPAGTAFIPLVYTAAFEKGYFPGTLLQDATIDNRQVMIGGFTGILGEWGPERADNKYEGTIPAREALVKSKNAATVRLGMQTGIDNVLAVAKKAGINNELRRFPATYLGSSEVTLMDLTLAYTLFPNGGVRPSKPFIISRIVDKAGEVIFEAKPDTVRAIKETTAYEIHTCLEEVLGRGTGDKSFAQYGLKKFPLGGKTGTAYNFTDTWFIGYSNAITCGVWAGFDKPQPIYRGAFSNEVVLPVWVDVMNASFARFKPKEIQPPRGLKKYEICLSSGQLSTDACFETSDDKSGNGTFQRRTTYFEIASEDQAPRLSCSVHGGTSPLATGPAAGNQPQANPSPQGQWPRAQLAVDIKTVQPVWVRGATVAGEDDPYNSVKPTAVRAAIAVETPPAAATGTNAQAPEPGTSPAPDAAQKQPGETEVRRAEAARPFDQPAVDSPIKLDPPPPMDF
jgi:penicillin-binding protein 1A